MLEGWNSGIMMKKRAHQDAGIEPTFFHHSINPSFLHSNSL